MLLGIAVATAHACMALLALGVSRAPRWAGTRPFAAVAGAAAGLTLAGVGQELSYAAPDRFLALARAALALSALHVAAWIPTLAAQRERRVGRGERVVVVVLLALGALALVPGALVRSEFTLAAPGTPSVGPTAAGVAAFGALCVVLGWIAVRLGARALRREPHSTWAAAGVLALLACALNDSLVSSGVVGGPLVAEFGLLALVLGTAADFVSRVVAQARRLDELTRHLEAEVAARTRELEEAHRALVRAERVALVGRLSGALAHEINNPAAVVLANLDYVQTTGALAALPQEAREALEESAASMRRVSAVVRRLLDVGRMLGPTRRREPLALGPLVEQAVTLARPLLAAGTAVEVEVEPGLRTLGDEELLRSVVRDLVLHAGNGARALGARVGVSGRRRGDAAVLTVAGDGPGVSPAARREYFDAFLSSFLPEASLGPGALQGLVQAQGGDLRLVELTDGRTALEVELPSAP